MTRIFSRTAAWAVLALVVSAGLSSSASAARWRRSYYRAPAATNAPAATRTPANATTVNRGYSAGPTGIGNGFNSGNSASGWNRSNSWYNIPQYGNYAPPPYATSPKAFIQVGPLPAFGGVRSLQGWGGAR